MTKSFRNMPFDAYFLRREPLQDSDYEDTYWGTVVDPDGNVRDRSQERERFLTNVRDELKAIRSLPPGRILDVGCGNGFLLSGIPAAWERHGVEVSTLAAKHAGQWGKISVGTLEEAAYPSQHFDVVVLHHVIEHVKDPARLIKEIRRILRSEGKLILGTPDFDSGCARRFGEKYRLLHDQTHITLFSAESMHRFLRDHGFIIERVDYPYFNTPYFTSENLERLFDTDRISPPFYGNFMTFYCRPTTAAEARRLLAHLKKRLSELSKKRTGG